MEHTVILGSAFAIANAEQENAHLLFRSAERVVLVDCGNNPVGKLEKAGVHINQISDLVLTHAHADHMGALPLLLMDMWLRKRTSSLKIYGLPITLEKANSLLDIFDWKKWPEMFAVEFVPVSETAVQTLLDTPTLCVMTGPVVHLIPTIGVRAEFKEIREVVTYSCDGEPSAGLDQLAKGTTILIQEAAGPGKGHTSPTEAGQVAVRAGARKLVLMHYDAARAEAEMLAESKVAFSGEVVLAKDLMVLN
ncbi:MAG: ribonuclease Z [Anaerolineaceae bacterium]|nr:ribonuclease Z [Anaerolineaceae bacterium]